MTPKELAMRVSALEAWLFEPEGVAARLHGLESEVERLRMAVGHLAEELEAREASASSQGDR